MRVAAAGLAVAAFAALLPGPASAHPRLVGTTPPADATVAAVPAVVNVRLSEPAEPVGAGISVTGPDGREVATGRVTVSGSALTRSVAADERGSYVVEWLAVGDDTHPARGAFLFSVGGHTRADLPGRAPEGVILQALGRWLSLAGLALGFGVPFAALSSGGMTTRLWRLVSGGVLLMLAAEPVALIGQMTTLAPSRILEPGFAQDVFLTNYGQLASLRLGAALGLWALAGALRDPAARAQWAIPAAGVAVAFVNAGSAHRIPGLPTPASFLLVATHVAAFGAWFGCVVVAVAEPRGRALIRPAVRATVVLVIAGSGLALAHLERPRDLVETAYGATLGLKLALVAVTLALGAAARHRLELAGALLVLGAAGLLVALLPPV